MTRIDCRQTNTPLTPVLAVAFSRDSSRLASTADNPFQTVKIWTSSNSDLVRTITYQGDWPSCVAITSNGEYVMAGGSKVRIWRVSDGVRVFISGPEDEFIHSLCFSPNDAYLSIGRSDGLNAINAPAGAGPGCR